MDRYQIIKKIGEGSFGSAFVVQKKGYPEHFVMKQVDLKKVVFEIKFKFNN